MEMDSEFASKIQAVVGGDFDPCGGFAPTLDVHKTQVVRVLAILHAHPDFKFEFLTDMVVVDHPGSERRFEVSYLILSLRLLGLRLSGLRLGPRICVRTYLEEDESLDSVTSMYKSADWLEQDITEVYGIVFRNKHN
ncbi:MAG: NADH-quinone oxidoreductase subunit C [Holosporales bacterium]|jgi:NADH:ubiquinone oxidoreductase subunit C|nr:NADH-quinone oxidoreductase subunit C [Holosporales bacterium]